MRRFFLFFYFLPGINAGLTATMGVISIGSLYFLPDRSKVMKGSVVDLS